MSKLGTIILPIILIIFSFLIGIKIASTNLQSSAKSNVSLPQTAAKVVFFNLSFCPAGNQMEKVLAPVINLLNPHFTFEPHYLFRRIDDVAKFCQNTSGDPSQCPEYVKNQMYPSIPECQKTINLNLSNCLDDKSYIKSPAGAYYGSLRGRQEANQNIREICAWQTTEKSQNWWTFINYVDQNCTADNADTCWENEAKKAGLDTTKITQCFNTQAIEIMDREIKLAQDRGMKVAPSLMVNSVLLPPINQNTTHSYTSETLKQSICSIFHLSAKTCSTNLPDISPNSPNLESCSQ